jgi:hypothetical protein
MPHMRSVASLKAFESSPTIRLQRKATPPIKTMHFPRKQNVSQSHLQIVEMPMKRVYLPVILLYLGTIVGQGGPNKQKPELFIAHFNPVKTPIFASRIPVDVCGSMIVEADKIIQSTDGNGFESVDDHDLLIASDNLRACATTAGIARPDRDLAVGLYGEAVAERQCRATKTK